MACWRAAVVLVLLLGLGCVSGMLWPTPLWASFGDSSVSVCSDFSVEVTGVRGSGLAAGDAALLDEVTGSFADEVRKGRSGTAGDGCWRRLQVQMERRGFLTALLQRRQARVERDFAEAELERLVAGSNLTAPLGYNERYALESSSTGSTVTLQADAVWGVVRGLQSLRQLWHQRRLRYLPFAVVDQPALAHRSVLIDCARYYYPLSTLRHIVHFIGSVAKMNVLHLHLTDDQSFMLDVASLPGLAKSLHGPDSPPYTAADMRDLVAYASRHGVRIVPEIGMPGHAASWTLADSRSAASSAADRGSVVDRLRNRLHNNNDDDGGSIVAHCPVYACGSEGWSIPLDPTNPRTYSVIEQVLDEVHSVFPDPFWHLGGDETSHSGGCWSEAVATRSASAEQLIGTFQRRLVELLRLPKYQDRASILWEEAWDEARTDYASVPFNVLNVWRTWDQKPASKFQKLRPADGHWVIQSGYWYPFDCLSPTACMQANPFDRIAGTQLLGGEISFWEWSPDHLLAMRAMSKAAAVAAKMWKHSVSASELMAYGQVCRYVAEERPGAFPVGYCQLGSHPSKPEFYGQADVRKHWNFLKCLSCKRTNPDGTCTPRTVF